MNFFITLGPDYVLLVLTHLVFCFVALRPKSTAMVMGGRSVHLTTLFPGMIELGLSIHGLVTVIQVNVYIGI